MSNPLLSICINTKNRSSFLKETLDSIIYQIDSGVEVVVFDGASTDDTRALMQKYISHYPFIKYFRSETHLGIDDGFDAAVEHATGTYCWLLPDDDLISKGGLELVLNKVKLEFDLIIVNMDLFTNNLSMNLNQRFFKLNEDKIYRADEFDLFLSKHGNGLSYIGCVIIKRELWFENDRKPFFGSYFVHVGVILSSTLIRNILFLHAPLIQYRSGNASWSDKSFEIWYFKWPDLVWSFENISASTKKKMTEKKPWRRALTLLKSRAMGGYNYKIYKDKISSEKLKWVRTYPLLKSRIPVAPLSISIIFLCLLFKRDNLYTIYDLMISSPYPIFSKKMIQLSGLKIG